MFAIKYNKKLLFTDEMHNAFGEGDRDEVCWILKQQ